MLLLVFGKPEIVLSADKSVHLISAEMPGGLFENNNGDYTGAYPAFFKEASKLSGASLDFRMVPWGRAVKETELSDNLLIFPFTRTAERENLFSWVTPLSEDKICFGSVGKAVDNLEDARKLKRVVVWQGTSNKLFLENQNFDNLVRVKKIKDAIRILHSSDLTAYYFHCDQIQAYLDPTYNKITLNIGQSVASEFMWLAAGKNFTPTEDTKNYVQAIDTLRKEGLLKNLLAEAAK